MDEASRSPVRSAVPPEESATPRVDLSAPILPLRLTPVSRAKGVGRLGERRAAWQERREARRQLFSRATPFADRLLLLARLRAGISGTSLLFTLLLLAHLVLLVTGRQETLAGLPALAALVDEMTRAGRVLLPVLEHGSYRLPLANLLLIGVVWLVARGLTLLAQRVFQPELPGRSPVQTPDP